MDGIEETYFLGLSEIAVRWVGLALFVLVIGVLVLYSRSGDKLKRATCPRCHHRVPGSASRCPNCGWSRDTSDSGRPDIRMPWG